MRLRKIGKIFLYSIAASVIVVAVLMLGVKLALDRAPAYQAEIKQWVHRQTGYHIAFAHVSPAFRWYGPELYFDRLELRTKDDSEVLARAAGGRIGVDIWQLLQNGKLFALRVELDSPNIIVARLGPTTFAVGSQVMLGGDEAALGNLTLNDLPAGTLVIRRGFVTVRNWNPALPRLDLSAVNLDASRVSHLIAVRWSAQLPSVLGGYLSFVGRAQGAGAFSGLEWSMLANTRGMSFPGWRTLLPEYLTRLDAGTGTFEVLVRGRGPTLERANLDFSAQGVVTKLSEGLNTKMEQVGGSLSLTHARDRWALAGRRLRAVRGGRRDPTSEFDVSWRDSDSGLVELRANANYLRAEALLPLVGLLPQKDLRDRLRDIAPTGEWTDMRLALKRASVDAPWQFDARAKFSGVGFAPVGRTPGLRGLGGSLAGNEAGGHVIIDTQTAVFNWPDEFPEPIGLPELKSTLYWRRTASEYLVATSNLELRTRDAGVRAKVAWHQPMDGSSPILTLASTIDDGNAAAAHLYLPREFIAPSALQWLNRALVAGHLSHADAVFDGPVRHFPFRDGSGLFLARCRIERLTLDYSEGWPRIENLAGQAEFRNEGLTVKISSGAIGDLKVESAEARFVDFKNGEMEVHASTRGDAANAVKYLAATPLDPMAEHAFSGVEVKGPLRATVDLFFPFRQFDRRRVLVHVELDGASVKRSGSTLSATDVSGDADIDGAQVVHADLRGRVLGGAFQMTARAPRGRPATRTQLDFRGTSSGEALRAALSLPTGLAIGGQADWHAVLKIAAEPARERSLRLTSNLIGLDLNFPQPLTKPAGTPMLAAVEVQWPASGQTQLRLNLGSVLRAAVNLEPDANGSRLGRAAIAFGGGEPVFSDAQSVNVSGDIDELDLAGWLRLGATAPTSGKPWTSYLRTARFDVGQIDYLGLSFREVTLALSEQGGGWRIQADGPNVAGTMTIPGPQDASAPWDLEFERLRFGDDTSANAPADQSASSRQSPADPHNAADGDGSVDPRNVPAIKLHVADLAWGDRQFGEVRATLVKLDDGIGLKELTSTNPFFSVNAKGDWRGNSSRIAGTITSTDVGSTLKQLGFAEVIQAKTGHLEFDMSWAGAPTSDDLAAATGHVQVALDKGQIVGLKPGAGRVLGLASVAELPRRLALDFSDLTDKGFAFDTVRGDFDLRDGSAHTDNVLVKGPAAEIGLIGRVGLKNHDYDQIAVVTGNVSNTLPLAAFVAGPVVGGAVLLFTQVFKQPLKGLVRGYYRITGTWDNPSVERIKGADAAAASAEAPK